MTTLQQVVAAAHKLEQQGFFGKAREGDQRAASLFARLTAYTLNPEGDESKVGWLSKTPGEQNVEGWAEDAVVLSADPNDLRNVVDLVNGAGARNASIGGAIKERRPNNVWAAPKPLSDRELIYLNPDFIDADVPPPQPRPDAQPTPAHVCPPCVTKEQLFEVVRAIQTSIDHIAKASSQAGDSAATAAHNATIAAEASLRIEDQLRKGFDVSMKVPTFGGTARGAIVPQP